MPSVDKARRENKISNKKLIRKTTKPGRLIYRTAASYISNDPEKRQKQLEALARGRETRKENIEKRRNIILKDYLKLPPPISPIYADDPIKFGEEQFIVEQTDPNTGRRGYGFIQFEQWQLDKFIKPIFYPPEKGGTKIFCDENGVWKRPTLVIISVPKKNGKSTVASFIASHFLFTGEDGSEVYLAAKDKDQSQDIIYKKIKLAIKKNPRFAAMISTIRESKGEIELINSSTLKCLPTDKSAAGLNANLIVFDELWTYEHEGMEVFFEEMTTVPTRKDPMILIVTYAGNDIDSLLYRFYDKGFRQMAVLAADERFNVDVEKIYGEEIEDAIEHDEFFKVQEEELKKGTQIDRSFFCFWSHKNRASWVSEDYLDQQKKGRLRQSTYLRLHENRWTSGEESFIPLDDYLSVVERQLSKGPIIKIPRMKVWGGLDIGTKRDGCAAAIVTVDYDSGNIILVDHRLYLPALTPADEKAKDKRVVGLDLEDTIEKDIIQWSKDTSIQEFGYDPHQAHRSAKELEKKYGIKMIEYAQSTENTVLMTETLSDLIKSGKFKTYEHVEVRSNLLNCKAIETQRGWRIVKSEKRKKIDLAVAIAIAVTFAVKMFGEKKDIRLRWLGSGEPVQNYSPLIPGTQNDPKYSRYTKVQVNQDVLDMTPAQIEEAYFGY